MKFFCEYCGYRIDADVDKKCPNCGATYKKNATFLRLEEEKKQRELEFRNQMEEGKKIAGKFGKVFLIIFISVFVIVLITIVTMMFGIGKIGKSITTQISDQIENQTEQEQTIEQQKDKKEEKVTVGLNEYGKTSKYQAKVTGYEKTTYWYKEAKEGYEYITFHLEVGNLTSSQIGSEKVNCIVDGVAQTNEFTSGYSTLPLFIASELTVTGDSTFEVPISAASYDIRYGDYITIHIEKE